MRQPRPREGVAHIRLLLKLCCERSLRSPSRAARSKADCCGERLTLSRAGTSRAPGFRGQMLDVGGDQHSRTPCTRSQKASSKPLGMRRRRGAPAAATRIFRRAPGLGARATAAAGLASCSTYRPSRPARSPARPPSWRAGQARCPLPLAHEAEGGEQQAGGQQPALPAGQLSISASSSTPAPSWPRSPAARRR